MKKRLLCLALCIVLLLPSVLASCKKSINIEEKFQQIATTLTMWVVTEDENSVSAEAAKLVNEKIDEITKSRFKVHLIVKYITEDVYRETIDNEIREFYNVRATTAPIKDQDDEKQYAETEVNEWGITVIKYPAALDHQVDIVYIQDKDMYFDYAKNGWLSSLNLELNGNSKALWSNINSAYLNAAAYNGDIYAIPNNHAVGEYTVMLLNKELMAETSMDAIYRKGQITDFFNLYVFDYLEEMQAKKKAGADWILPINASYEDCLNLLAYYWNINPDTLENEETLSVLGYRYGEAANLSRSTELAFTSLFADQAFTDAFLKLNEYRFDGGYFGTLAEGQTAALTIAKMDYADLAAYRAEDSEYYPVVLRNPTISEEDLYGSMFGVCSQTVSLEHSMKVLTLLNTNAEFRNLLQYGVEGKTYEMIPDAQDNTKSMVSYLPDYQYRMDIFKTGNAFLAYPLPEMEETVWENGKVQNRDIAGAASTLNLDFRSIAVSTIPVEEEDFNVGYADYVYTVKTGLDREFYLQNPALKKWIEASDQKGKGVYLLKFEDKYDDDFVPQYFIYNNQTKGDLSVTDAGGGTVTLNFKGTAAGSTLGQITMKTRTNYTVNFVAQVNGANTPVTRTTQYYRPDFDALNTGIYQVRVNQNIQKSAVSSNAVVWNWLETECAEAKEDEPQVLQSVKTLADGTLKYTYLVYTTGMKTLYTVWADVKGGTDALTVDLFFDDTNEDLYEDDPDYALWLVTVETDAAVKAVNFRLSRNEKSVTPTVTTAEELTFTYCGTLNSEHIRYLYEFNADLMATINTCTTIGELKKMIAEVQTLLTPQGRDWSVRVNKTDSEGNLIGYAAEVERYDVLRDFVANYDLQELNNVIRSSISTEKVNLYGLTSDTEGNLVVDVLETDNKSGEPLATLDSAFALYHNWLKQNGYLK